MQILKEQELVFANAYSVLLHRYLKSVDPQAEAASLTKTLTIKQLDQLVRRIFKATGNLGFGLEIGRQIHPSDYGAVGYAVLNCQTVLEALHTATKYHSTLSSGFYAELCEEDNELRYRIKNAQDLICLFPMIDLDFASGIQFARLLAGPRNQDKIRLKSVHFRHLPLAKRDAYEAHFRCPIEFGSDRNEAVLERDFDSIPVHNANPKLFQLLDQKLTRFSRDAARTETFNNQLRQYLKSQFPQTIPNQLEAAQHFCISVSCCKTRLKKEGTNFQNVLDEVRSEEAKRELAIAGRSIKEISFNLGFASQSAFNRAFKRWTGMSPRSYRDTRQHKPYLSA